MSESTTRDGNVQSDQRIIGALCDFTGRPDAQVRALFASEFVRLGRGAAIRSYLGLLAAASVRAILGRRWEPLRSGRGTGDRFDGAE
jgi:hypothetical protein